MKTVGSKREKEKKMHSDFGALYQQAHLSGMVAGKASIPTPMIVQQHKNQLDDSSSVTESWYVGDGVCGFAWIQVKPGTCSFARWLVKEGKGKRDSYYGGISIWVREFNQSYERKMAYAQAFANMLVTAGIRASSNGRLD